MNNIYRLGKNKPEVKIEFVSYLTKSKVITNRRKLKGYRVYISEDLCEEDHLDFKLLRQNLNLTKRKNYKAYIRSGCLFVDGERYSIQQLKEKPISDRIPSTIVIDKGEELVNSQSGESADLVASTPNSPAPLARVKQMVTEHEHLLMIECSKTGKDKTGLGGVGKDQVTVVW